MASSLITTMTDGEPAPENLPNQELAQYRFLLQQTFVPEAEKAEIKSKLLDSIRAESKCQLRVLDGLT